MKTTLSLFLVAAVAGTVACSDDGAKPRGEPTAAAGTGGQTGAAGTPGTGGSAGAATTGGTSGAGGGTSSGVNTGPALVITADGVTATVVDTAGTTGLNGLAQMIKSPLGTTATAAMKDGGLCMNGTTVIVPNADYTNYWGAEIDLDVKLTGNPGAGAVVDAGADAGGDAGAPPAQVPEGWNASAANVVGFSFKLDGPTVPVAFRFKALPFGAPSATTTYCNQVAAAPTGPTTVNVLFSEITRDCWMAGGAAALTEVFPGNPDGKLLRTISWQVPADITIPFPFDFCVSDLKPILGN